MVKELLLVIKKKRGFRAQRSQASGKSSRNIFVSLKLSIDVFTKKQWLVVLWFRFGVHTISLYVFTGNSNLVMDIN